MTFNITCNSCNNAVTVPSTISSEGLGWVHSITPAPDDLENELRDLVCTRCANPMDLYIKAYTYTEYE